jgi:hypothetical protein
MVAHILMCHYVQKSTYTRMIQLSFGVHFQFAKSCNGSTFFKKWLISTIFTWNFSTKICTFKYENIKNNLQWSFT